MSAHPTASRQLGEEPVGNFELFEHLPHLFKHIYSQLQAAWAAHLAGFGVNAAVWHMLAVLWEHDELSHRELAELTCIEVSTLSRLSKSAEREGLIRRTRTREDQRSVRVTLSEKGRHLAREIIPSALGCQADMLRNLSATDVATVTRLLHAVVKNLSAYSNQNADADQTETSPQPTRQNGSSHDARLLEIEPGSPRRELLRDPVTEIE